MDPGLIKLLEDDEEDGSGPAVSGAAVDAYTERLKGELGDGGAGGAAGAGAGAGSASAYGLAQAGNGSSLKPVASPAPAQAPTPSSVPPATGNGSAATTTTATPAVATPTQITQAQWNKLTPQQQQVYRQQLLLRQQQAQRQSQQQQQQLPGGAPQQQAAGAAAALRRPTSISQGISFGALMPLLQPHLPAEQSERLSALYQRFKQNEITREDFVRGARVIVGDQVLVQTIRQMHQKQQQQAGPTQQQGGSQQAVSQQLTGPSPQSGGSSQATETQQLGSSSKAATQSGPSAQASTPLHVAESQSSQSKTEQVSGVAPSVPARVQSQQQQVLQHQGNDSSQGGASSVGSQQSKGEVQTQGSSQTGQPPGLLQATVTARQNSENQSMQGGEATSQGVSGAAPILQQVKNEVVKAVGPAQAAAARPLQVPASSPYGGFQARPPAPPNPHTVVGGQVHPGIPAQVPRAPTPMQFNAVPQAGQVRPGFSQAMSDSSQQLDQKPLTKYARAKIRKEQKKAEEEERARKLEEAERLRTQQGGMATVGSSHPQTPTQVAQSLSMPVGLPQPHPKLLEGKQTVVHGIPAVKPEPQSGQHAGAASQRGPMTHIQTGQVGGIRVPGRVDVPESTGAQATSTATKEVNVGGGGGEKSQVSTPQAASPMSRYPGVPGVGNPAHPIAGGATAGGSSTPQGGGGVKQGPSYVLASELRSPAMNFSTGSAAPGVKDASGSGSGGPGGSGAQAASGGAKTPVKKPSVAVGQKKPGEAIPAASQPANKKQKTQGPEADQSIDALNDVTAVSGVNLKEEEEQLLAGPKEESRTTEAMRKFVQEEEERLFLERGPLRAKVKAIAAKAGLKDVSEDMERFLSLACEERLRSMLYRLIKYSKQRFDVEKDHHRTVVGFDPRRQVLLMKRRAKEAMEKKQAAENERLRKLNEKKDKGVLADGDNEDLRLKAQKAQQEEDDKMRAKAANVAARAAVGATDMLSKWQMMAAQGLAKRQGGDTASESAGGGSVDDASGSREQDGRQENGEAGKSTGPGRTDTGGDGAGGGRPPGPGAGTTRGNAVRRIGAGAGGRQPRSMTMKDVIALLEREPVMSKSSFLYRLYERRDRKGESSRRL